MPATVKERSAEFVLWLVWLGRNKKFANVLLDDVLLTDVVEKDE